MTALVLVVIIVGVLALLGLLLAVRVVMQYEQGVLFRFGRLAGTRDPGLRLIFPGVDVLRRVSLRIVTMPIQSQGIRRAGRNPLLHVVKSEPGCGRAGS